MVLNSCPPQTLKDEKENSIILAPVLGKCYTFFNLTGMLLNISLTNYSSRTNTKLWPEWCHCKMFY